jgi:tight adherence protein B
MNSAALALGLASIFGALLLVGLVLTAPTGETTNHLKRLRAALRRRPPNARHSLQSLAEHASDVAERSLQRSGHRGGLEAALEKAAVDMRPGEFMVLTVTGAVVALAIGLVLGGPVIALIFASCAVGGARFYLKRRAEHRLAKFDSQLERTLPLMAGSLRAGYGIMQALDVVARESESPTADEFRRLVMESRLGRDLGESLDAMSERVKSEDFNFVVQAIEIHREVGGDLAEVLDHVADTIRDRNRVRGQVRALTAEGRLSAGILFVLPFVMCVVIQILNPVYFHELTSETLGQVMLAFGLGLLIVGGLWMRRLIRLVF